MEPKFLLQKKCYVYLSAMEQFFRQIDNSNLLWYDGEQEDQIEGHCVIFPYTSNVYALATRLPHLY